MRLCRIVVRVLIVAYVLALVLLCIGYFGLFGQQRDPLSAIFVVILGQPWVNFADLLPPSMHLGAAVLSPLLTIGLVAALCRWINRGVG